MLLALIHQGDAERAHKALQMLLPVNHARTREQAENYRLEPYVMAADIYTHPDHAGRGGWSWYTGSAAWMLQAVLSLIGYERRGSQVRLHALLGAWPEVRVRLQWGRSAYTLICRRDVLAPCLDGETIQGDFISLTDDGRDHIALFPARQTIQEPTE
jgi:cellobiose phosphorylase